MSFLDDLQNKPGKEKTKILWILVGISTFLIFTLWLFVFPKNYLKEGQNEKKLGDLKSELNISDQDFEEFKKNIGLLEDFEEGLSFEELQEKIGVTDQDDIEEEEDEIDSFPRTYRLPLEE